MKITPEEQKQMDEAMDKYFEYLKDIENHNNQIISSISMKAVEEWIELIEDLSFVDKIEIVQEPKGTDNDECYEVFTKVFVDQRSVGDSGDSYQGFMYLFDSINNRWLRVFYTC